MKLKTQQLRIIGGEWRSRRVSFPDIDGLRPTLDRVRETVFNWLQSNCPNSYVIDLFAGSGALGLEALSRGAQHAIFVERHPQAASALSQNLHTLNATQAQVIQTDAVQWLISTAGQTALANSTLVFLDPPFHSQLLQPCLDRLNLPSETLVYVEYEPTLQPQWPLRWQVQKMKTTKEFIFCLFKVTD